MMARISGAQPPGENRYDVLGKTLAPMVNVLLSGGSSENRAASLEFVITEVTGPPAETLRGRDPVRCGRISRQGEIGRAGSG